MTSKIMNKIQNRKKPNDNIYTPNKVVDIMLKFCDYKKGQSVLDPCRGKGAIYDKLFEPKFYCEIDEDINFFDWDKKIDIIIQNPPYSMINKFLIHSMKYSNKMCILIGQYSLTPRRIVLLKENNFYITKMLLTKIPSWFQRSYILVIEKLELEPKTIIFNSIDLGNRCLYCGCPCGGMRGKNIRHCKRKSKDLICSY